MQKKTILIVDDERRIVEELRDIFSREGYSVASAVDGERALEQFDKNEIDLVLLDIKMPKIDGVVVCHEMRKIRPDMPIIVITGSIGNKDSDHLLKMGAKCIFYKPFDIEKLVATVKEYAPLNV